MGIPWTDSICIRKNEGWFVPGKCNALFHIDFTNRSYSVVDVIPDEKMFRTRCYSKSAFVKDIICMPSYYEGKIYFYNITEKKLSDMVIPQLAGRNLNGFSLFEYCEVLYLIYANTKSIYVIEPKRKKIVKVIELEVEENTISKAFFKNGVFLFRLKASRYLCRYDIYSGKCSTIDTMISDRISDICFLENDRVAIVGFKHHFYIFNLDTSSIEDIVPYLPSVRAYFGDGQRTIQSAELEYEAPLYNNVFKAEDTLVFVPYLADRFCKYNTVDKTMEEFVISEEIEDNTIFSRELRAKYLVLYQNRSKVLLLSLKKSEILQVDVSSNYYRYIELEKNASSYGMILGTIFEKEGIISEGFVSAEDFIAYIAI